MAEKKQESFTVTDRRLFTPEGEIRQEVSQEEVSSVAPTPQPAPVAQPELAPPLQESDAPPAPPPPATPPGARTQTFLRHSRNRTRPPLLPQLSRRNKRTRTGNLRRTSTHEWNSADIQPKNWR